MPRGETRRVAGEPQIESRHHLARGHENEKGFPLRPPLHSHERLDRIVIGGAAEAVHGLGGIREHLARGEVRYGAVDRGGDFGGRPEGDDEWFDGHRTNFTSPSSRAKSSSVVTFIPVALPSTITTRAPMRSHSVASSVAVARSA